jgi:hypothetical protein
MLFSSMGFCQGELLIGVDLLLFFCFEFPFRYLLALSSLPVIIQANLGA